MYSCYNKIMIDINKAKLKIERLARENNLKFVILYGSQARGAAKNSSDIDIAVLGEKTISFAKLVDLINEFTDILETNEVDVKSLHNTDPLFRYEVTREGILLYGDEKDYVSFKAYAFRDYMDSCDLFRLKEIIIKKRLAHLGA